MQKDAQDAKVQLQQVTKELTDTKEENQELKSEINKLSQELNDIKKNQTQDAAVPDEKTTETTKEDLSNDNKPTNSQN